MPGGRLLSQSLKNPNAPTRAELAKRKAFFDAKARELGDNVGQAQPRTNKQKIEKELPRLGSPVKPKVKPDGKPFTQQEVESTVQILKDNGVDAEPVQVDGGYGYQILTESDQFGDFMYDAEVNDLERRMQGPTEVEKGMD